MMGRKGQLKDFEKWPNFKKAYLRAFEKILAVRRERNLKTEWQTAKDIMDWWLRDLRKKKDPNQLMFFSD